MMYMTNEDFIKALKANNIELLKSIPKSDLHNHAESSCVKEYLTKNGIDLSSSKSIIDIASLISFNRTFIKPLQDNIKTLPLLLKGNFDNCIDTGVTIVAPSIDYKICMRVFNSDIEAFINFLSSFQYKTLTILWTLQISRDSYLDEYKQLILELLETKFFDGLDIAATEDYCSNEKFIDFYKLANSLGMTTKVHAGEQLGPDYILSCINDFNPKQIQHGITIVKDEQVMKLAKEKNIVFNVCPTSNVVLGYAESIKEHPIKRMYEYGLKVTIATDDLLFFDSNINEEYLKLFNNNVLTAEQLDKIRQNGLRSSVVSE